LLKGCLISPEENNIKKHFRIANMGTLEENDICYLTTKIKKVLQDMRMEIPLKDVIF